MTQSPFVQTDAAEVRLPRPPGVIRRAFAAHPRAVDIGIVVSYLFGCLLMSLLDIANSGLIGFFEGEERQLPGYLVGPALIFSTLRVLLVAAALLFRRRFPLLGLVVVGLAQLGEHQAQGIATAVALYFMIYAVPVHRGVRAGWLGFGIAVVTNAVATFLPTSFTAGGPINLFAAESADVATNISATVMNGLWMLAILMLGINLGNRRRYVEAIIDRAHQLARERDQLAQLAVAEERSRIAREMHDIVAHSVSVMITLSEGAARAAATAPDAATDAMRRSAETGRTALAEMRRLLGALQSPEDGGAELAPQPGVTDIPQLVQSFRDAGLNVGLELAGGDLGDRGQELAVYRIVQEALTNVLRYAGPEASATVIVRASTDGTLVEVRDSGRVPGATGPLSGVGSGRGLAGLAERVRVFGGHIESGRIVDGPGWRVRATFPVHAATQGGAERAERDRHPKLGEGSE
ncbi:two-component sensor histidine kinase [Leucobacter insecticola]|uniref:histidine kinase n=1 Tax=Leucobacter insecticola TaxID=2714934 RepID=A0A6G8FKU1_9MICO|nr:histidine kinase [Leucobacter insecticola]QIM16692.1 two-component sensor histidine kinase [Leucobacter insecticola]